MTMCAGAAGLVLDLTLREVIRELGRPNARSFVWIVAAGLLASLVYATINLQLVHWAVRIVYGTRDFVPWSRMSVFVASHLTMGLVGSLLGATISLVEDAAVLPLILAVYLIGHLSLSSHSQLREAHEATLRGFVKALEAKDLYTRGHTERVAYFAQLTGRELSFSGTQLERLRWAALIHDVGKLAVPDQEKGPFERRGIRGDAGSRSSGGRDTGGSRLPPADGGDRVGSSFPL
jgi:hypothetical protein